MDHHRIVGISAASRLPKIAVIDIDDIAIF
jgi:hypothetical protein